LLVASGIAITDIDNEVVMLPTLGLNSDTSVGTSTIVVKTTAQNGYTLTLKASTSPALIHTDGVEVDSFADYSNFFSIASLSNPHWSVDVGNKEFGYSAFGDNVLLGYGYYLATHCGGVDPGNSDLNYTGFVTENPPVLAQNSGPTGSDGSTIVVCFGAEQNDVLATSGEYQAQIIATAIVNLEPAGGESIW